MKIGLHEGYKHSIKVTVTPQMFAQFEGNVVHPVYSTVSMVYHMEWVSRQIILPFLEKEEEGMGAEVKVKHISPSKVGSELEIVANVTTYTGSKVETKVEIYDRDRLIGIGEVKQVILPKTKINELINN